MGKKGCGRCMGDCCKDIGLDASPETLERAYFNYLNSKKNGREFVSYTSMSKKTGRLDGENIGVIYSEIDLLYPMLTFLRKDNIHPDGEKKIEGNVYHYSCKHLDRKTGDCTIYNIRPSMCRHFASETICHYKSCKWDKQIEARKKEVIDVRKKIAAERKKRDKKMKDLPSDKRTFSGNGKMKDKVKAEIRGF